MKRRELLKAILPVTATPLWLKGEVVGEALKVEQEAKYVVVIKPTARISPIEFGEFAAKIFPEGTPVFIGEEDDIKIFKL